MRAPGSAACSPRRGCGRRLEPEQFRPWRVGGGSAASTSCAEPSPVQPLLPHSLRLPVRGQRPPCGRLGAPASPPRSGRLLPPGTRRRGPPPPRAGSLRGAGQAAAGEGKQRGGSEPSVQGPAPGCRLRAGPGGRLRGTRSAGKPPGPLPGAAAALCGPRSGRAGPVPGEEDGDSPSTSRLSRELPPPLSETGSREERGHL